MSASRKIRIMNLGDIISPVIQESIRAFINAIASKKQNADIKQIGNAVGLVLSSNKQLLDDFKLGKVSEEDFTTQMIEALEKATQVKLTNEEFDNAWHAMNPRFEQFQDLLKQIMDYNDKEDQKIIFVSFTNPKDISHLKKELESNQHHLTKLSDQLITINGIPLYTTYLYQKTKAELIENVINIQKNQTSSLLANSLSVVFNSSKPVSDIKYIRRENSIEIPVLRKDLDNVNETIKKVTEEYFVDTIMWTKDKTLSEVLNNQETPSTRIAVANL